MPSLHFTYPQYLLLLPLAWAFTWWVHRRSLADLGTARGRLALGVRAALLTLVVLALAGIQLVRPTARLCTVFVVDVSDSIAPAQEAVVLDYIHQAVKGMRAGDAAALVAFGAEALLDHAPEDAAAIAHIVSLPNRARTNIAAGIQMAMASFPADMGKQIVLFSDGNENLGNALEQAALAHAGDVRISVVPLRRDTERGEALLLRAEAPAEVKQGAPFQVAVVAESQQDVDAVVTLERNAMPVESRRVHLAPGKTVLTFEQSVPASGLYHYRATLQVPAANDAVPDNNTAFAYVRVQGKPTVLVVEGAPGDGTALAGALRAQNMQVVLGGPERIPATLAECAQYESVVFANVPAWYMSPAQMTILQSAVRDMGLGFCMVGGERSFGAGGYYRTPVETLLPVTMDVKQKKILPALSLVIVIDISGSMGALESGVPKIRLAAEAAAKTVELLQPIDQICIIGYDTKQSFTYVVPMTKAENKAHIIAQAYRLQPGGGGIDGYSAQLEAYNAVRKQPTQLKHVILCMDAADDDEPGDAVNLAAEMRRNHVTVSVVGFGSKQDPFWKLFQDIAKSGGGNAYITERIGNLPQILTRDLLFSSRSLLVEKPFHVQPQDTVHPITRDVPWRGAPPLLGYVATSVKSPGARLLLASPFDEDPILAAWSYGLGRSLAFTSDAAAHWGAPWLGWDEYSTFWAQSLRWTLRQGGQANFETTLVENQGRTTIIVDALTPEGDFRNLLDLRAHVSHVSPAGIDGPEAQREVLPLSPTAPGRYEASFETRKTGTYVVTVEERDGDTLKGLKMATLVVPYSPEFQQIAPNHRLLEAVARETRGETDPAAADIFGRLRVLSRTLHDVWPSLVAAFALLFLLDVGLRRILLPWGEFFATLRSTVAARLPAWAVAGRAPRQRARSAVLGGLLETKARVRGPRPEKPVLLPTPGPPEPDERQFKLPPPEASRPALPPEAAQPEQSTSLAGSLLQKKRDRGTK